MPIMNRRRALQAFGIASFTPLLSSEVPVTRRAVVVPPGENRYAYTVAALKTGAACKLTTQDTNGACSIFELVTPPKMGSPRHVHHREDEWYYVLSGEFVFEAGEAKHTLSTGAAIWAPRDIPHVWANNGATDGRMILLCQPGGFERFFDEFAKVDMSMATPEHMGQLMTKYGMEMLGPPLFAPVTR